MFTKLDSRSISPYSVRMRENTDQNNSEYGHFSRSDINLTSSMFQLKSTSVYLNIVLQKYFKGKIQCPMTHNH